MKKKTNNTIYIDNNELEQELLQYLSTKIISNRLGQICLDLCNNILLHASFRNYNTDLKDEMRSFAIEKLMKYGIMHFDPAKKSKAFSYFSRIIFTSYMTIIMKYYKRLNKEQAYRSFLLKKYAYEYGNTKLIAEAEQFQTSYESTQDDN